MVITQINLLNPPPSQGNPWVRDQFTAQPDPNNTGDIKKINHSVG